VSLTGPEWTRRYEALRAHATGEASLAFVPLGLALLWHRGVAAWMAAESSAIGAERLGERVAGRNAALPLEAPRSELVRLLAGTALLAARGRAS
jgi:hypothetical protein